MSKINWAGHKASHRKHLDLVKDDDGANLSRALDDLAEPLHLGLVQASLTLDRLDDEASRVLIDELLETLLDVHLADLDTGQQGRKGVLVLGVRRDRERAERAAVEGTLEADDVRLARLVRILLFGEFAHEFQRALVGLGARISEEDFAGRVDGRLGRGREAEAAVLLCQVDEQVGARACPLVMVNVG